MNFGRLLHHLLLNQFAHVFHAGSTSGPEYLATYPNVIHWLSASTSRRARHQRSLDPVVGFHHSLVTESRLPNSLASLLEDETVDSSECFHCEELDLVLNLIHIVARVCRSPPSLLVRQQNRQPVVLYSCVTNSLFNSLRSLASLTENTDSSSSRPCCWVCSTCSFLLLGLLFLMALLFCLLLV